MQNVEKKMHLHDCKYVALRSLCETVLALAVRGSKIYVAGAKSRRGREREREEQNILDEVARLRHRM